MKVFISWSGERSGQVATALAGWLPKVIQATKPWLSSASIDAGARWGEEVGRALEELQCGVLCLTPENLESPWILFEAGALSKAVSASRVIPYLLGFEPRQIGGPLSQFQAVRADEEGTRRLLIALNAAAGGPVGSQEALEESFEVWWPKLQPELVRLGAQKPRGISTPSRSLDAMMGEVLELLRAQRATPDADAAAMPTTSEPEARLTVGAIIRGLRIKRRWTTRELAMRAAVSERTVSSIETEAVRPSARTLQAISSAFGINLFSYVDVARDLGNEDSENAESTTEDAV